MSGDRQSSLTKILLASSSPRRWEIMQGVENGVEVFNPSMNEGPRLTGESAEQYVCRLSREKAKHAIAKGVRGTILTADTTVVLNNEILGKPDNTSHAREMLKKLRGRIHHVLTGVAVARTDVGEMISDVRSTAVYVRAYSDSDVEAYVKSGVPMDRAGAYGVQDAPFNPVTKVEGCYLNVVGLPLCSVVTLMMKVGINLKLRPASRVPYIDRCDSCELVSKERAK